MTHTFSPPPPLSHAHTIYNRAEECNIANLPAFSKDSGVEYVFFERKICFHKKIIHTIPNTLYTKRKKKKAKKRPEVLKEGTERKWGSHYVIQTIENRET